MQREPAFERSKAKLNLVPTCDGKPLAQLKGADTNAKTLWNLKREFVDVYHVVNRHYAKLREHRARRPTERDQPSERLLLQKIETALIAKENLENRSAARGISVTPVYRDGFTIDLRFQHPGAAKYLVAGSSASRFVTLSLPPEFELTGRGRSRVSS